MDKIFCSGCNHWFDKQLGNQPAAQVICESDSISADYYLSQLPVSPYERQPDFSASIDVKQLTSKLEDYYSQNNHGVRCHYDSILSISTDPTNLYLRNRKGEIYKQY